MIEAGGAVRKGIRCLVISCLCQVLLLAALLCVHAAEQGSPFSAIAPKDALDFIHKNRDNPNFVLIDVRTPEEFSGGHIEGAININYNEGSFVGDLNRLDKEKTYLIYCRTGRRSVDTLNIMKRLGFKTVYRIAGDITRWKSQGLPVVRSGK
jgi:rhodanese-related sulfurtransferase